MTVYSDVLNVMYTVTAAELAELEATALSYQYNAEAWAVGKKNGTDVSSTDPTYHNNSKWYAQQASGSASSAAEDADLAGQYAQAASTTVMPMYTRPFEDLLASTGDVLLDSNGGHICADAMSLNEISVYLEKLDKFKASIEDFERAMVAMGNHANLLYETLLAIISPEENAPEEETL